jgi:cation diffusion facilitator CzcD-associated flavoprotein CzcO
MSIQPKQGPRVVVIGAGFSGLIAGIELRRAGFDNFTLYEREASFGGTWYVNRFPGCAVDTESEIYRLSYLPYNWSRSHAAGAEVLQYMRHAVERYGLASHIRCNASVQRIEWDDECSLYEIQLADGTRDEANTVISAVGMLSEPNHPDWPGLHTLKGKVVHTANWDPAIDYRGKRVAVVGTGSTSAQVVPEMAKQAAQVMVFQRQPGWVLPKTETLAHTEAGPTTGPHEDLAHDVARRLALKGAAQLFADGRLSQLGSEANRKAKEFAEAHLRKSLEARPDLIDKVLPDYPFLGKRPVQSNEFYPALMQPNVQLVSRAVTRATPDGLVDADGVEHGVDIVVLATGYRATEYLRSVDVRGREGMSLHGFWANEARAYLGVAVPHFPNFFMLYGPNTNATGSLLQMFEQQAAFAVECLRAMEQEAVPALEVSEQAFDEFNDWLGKCFENSAFRSTRNYFVSESGRVVTNWPRSVLRYCDMLRAGRASAMVDSRTVRRAAAAEAITAVAA